jgi:hypothetical protein
VHCIRRATSVVFLMQFVCLLLYKLDLTDKKCQLCHGYHFYVSILVTERKQSRQQHIILILINRLLNVDIIMNIITSSFADQTNYFLSALFAFSSSRLLSFRFSFTFPNFSKSGPRGFKETFRLT